MNTNETAKVELTPETREAESRFKSIDKKPARKPVKWAYAGFVENCDIAIALNHAIETYGRQMLQKNGADWDWVPTPENCNLSALVADLQAETTRARLLTKETLEACAAYYQEAAQRILGKTEAAGKAGAALIASKLAQCSGAPDVARALRQNIIAIVEEDTFESVEPHAKVLERLLVMLLEFEQSQQVEADAL